MRRRLAFAAAALSLLVLFTLIVWQGSFSLPFSPNNLRDTVSLWAVSTLIFILTVVLGFMLFRAWVKLYIDRQSNREGSRIRSKLLIGALALTLAPTLFSTLFNYTVLNRTLDKWFTLPTREMEANLAKLNDTFGREAQERVQAEANWISLLPQSRDAVLTGRIDDVFFRRLCEQHGIHQVVLQRVSGVPLLAYQRFGGLESDLVRAAAVIKDEKDRNIGQVSVVATRLDPQSSTEKTIGFVRQSIAEQKQLAQRKKFYQDTYFLLICTLTLFVLFFAAWSAQILSRQISIPISALLGAAQQVRGGNLAYRVRVRAMDELATLVRAFNEMTGGLESNARELEARRSFTEAILESIPSGVISLSADERIERVNRALSGIFPHGAASSAALLEDLFQGDDLDEVRYLLKRALRTGVAASQLEIQRDSSVMHLAVTVASLESHRGFVLVLEDTSDLLRAQRVSAWQEVARRIAHEIKNPLTPISLSADRIARQLKRTEIEAPARAVLEECTQTIQQEVQTVKALVDEFSQFSRFPTAQLAPSDLNEIVEGAMAVFAGRLQSIEVSVDLAPSLPPVMADREQLKRVIVNLIDNAAEAMHDIPFRMLQVATSLANPETVELAVTDTGVGISATDKERLFLPYFSTKNRGTGLGLAIVSKIVTEHRGRVRVEDNQPTGARFIIELGALNGDSGDGARRTEDQPVTLKV